MPGGNGAGPHHHIAIVGTGFSGLGLTILLQQEGIDDVVLLERAEDIGGTWRDNSYPGCQCDIPSHLYSLSFAPNPNWTRTYSYQPEIWDYLRSLAEEHDVIPKIRFGHDVTSARWDEASKRWNVATTGGSLTCDILVSSIGGLADPRIPEMPGLDDFEGDYFHSAAWNHDVDIGGKRVGVVGTGASAIQIVPKIQPEVAQLDVFQRTPPWVMPHRDRAIPRFERWLYRSFPPLQRVPRYFAYWFRELMVLGMVYDPRRLRWLERVGRRHMESAIEDPALREKLIPNYLVGCKRILPSNDWYPALAKPNVDVVTDEIERITPKGILTSDGVEHELDTIVFATGFFVTELPFAERVRGRGGRTLREAWNPSMQAYLGTTVSGFPNLFFIAGPNVGLGHNSILVMFEGQMQYAMGAIRAMRSHGATTIELRPEVQDGYNRALQKKLQNTVWNSGGCKSWYLDKNGTNSVIWPDFTWRFRLRTQKFDPESYVMDGYAAGPVSDSADGTVTRIH
jgi:cation diffusion facilitator CzcD-associated flavoprotein CzcO